GLPGDAGAWAIGAVCQPPPAGATARRAHECLGTPEREARGGRGLPACDRAGHSERHPHGASGRLSRPRAVVLVTGRERVRGDRADLNGPFLARELLARGFEPARIVS